MAIDNSQLGVRDLRNSALEDRSAESVAVASPTQIESIAVASPTQTSMMIISVIKYSMRFNVRKLCAKDC